MVLLPDRVQVVGQPKANTKMSYPVNNTPSSTPIFDDTKHCSKCGVILTEYHKCSKWNGRNRKAKGSHQPRNHSSQTQKRKLDSLMLSKSETSNTRCVSTQTEAITCSQTSTTTQTDDVQVDRNENVTRDILEKMACSRLLLYHLQSFMADLNIE